MWSLSWIRTWRSVGWSLMKECLRSCSVDGRLVYVFTRQPSIKSMNFLDLGGRGRLEDDKLVKESGRVGRHGIVGSWAVIAQKRDSSGTWSVLSPFNMSSIFWGGIVCVTFLGISLSYTSELKPLRFPAHACSFVWQTKKKKKMCTDPFHSA